MPLADDLDAAAQPDEVERLRARLAGVEQERNQARSALATVEQENETLRQVAEFSKRPLEPPKWLKPAKRGEGRHRATICTVLSDTHYTEVIRPEEMGGVNAFNMEIAEQRLERYFNGVIKVPRQYMKGVDFDGVCMFSAGDLMSGIIHDLVETNETTQMEGALRWAECIIAGCELVVDEYGRLHVAWTVGNHGRFTHYERTKGRVKDNTDYLIANLVAKHFAKDDRVTFQIPEDIDVRVEVNNTKYLMYHGQPGRGSGAGSGIGGIWPTIMRMRHKKATAFSKTYPFDILVMGHWHQLIYAPDQGIIINGSLKGYDEYVKTISAGPERAQQALWLDTPEHGPTNSAPILVADPKAEGWG